MVPNHQPDKTIEVVSIVPWHFQFPHDFRSHSSHAKTLIMTVQVAVGKAVHHAIATGDPAVLKKMPCVQRGLFSRKTPAKHTVYLIWILWWFNRI